eukprot:scaffold670308_cov61-Prasinocladus_malaysianus.AAC.1
MSAIWHVKRAFISSAIPDISTGKVRSEMKHTKKLVRAPPSLGRFASRDSSGLSHHSRNTVS